MSKFQCDVKMDGKIFLDQVVDQKTLDRMQNMASIEVVRIAKLKKGETSKPVDRKDDF